MIIYYYMKPYIPDANFYNIEKCVNKKDDRIFTYIIEANTAIAEYNGVLEHIINPSVLLSPMTTREAILSSRIEGTIASAYDVIGYEEGIELEEGRRNDTQEVINYRKSLNYGKASVQARKLSLSLIKEMHQILMEGVRGEKQSAGRFRTGQNYIAHIGKSIEEARFIPPSPDILSNELDKFYKFIDNKTDVTTSLIQLSMMHAMFEILHPFEDGNGRLGRMLVPLFLIYKKIMKYPSFYISEYLEKNDQEYRDRLLHITQDNNWQDWCIFFIKGIKEQAFINTQRAKSILTLYDNMKEQFVSITQSKYSQIALDTFFELPIISSNTFAKKIGVGRTTANSILSKLVRGNLIKIGIEGKGRKPAIYILKKLIDLAGEE